MSPLKNSTPVIPDPHVSGADYRFLFFSQLLERRVCAGKIKDKIGKLSDLVFKLSEAYPEAVGLYLEHGWGKPTEFIPWEKVVKIEDDAIFVQPPEGGAYPPFIDQVGWLLLNDHLMGRTILDMDGRRIEVVNDVHLLESRGRMIIVHVDISFNGFLRKWHLGKLAWSKDQLISWKYVQPLSLEDASTTDAVVLSLPRKMVKDLPSEDLADALEQLSGEEQQAFFSALDSESAADALAEAEPRVQRQIIANLRHERAQTILSELSVTQLADLFSVLPRDHMMNLMALLPKESASRISAILSEREGHATALMSSKYVTAVKTDTVGAIMRKLRTPDREHEEISYVYVINPEDNLLLGVVDLRELVLADDNATIGSIMTSPVVAVESDDLREDIAELFAKYHYRMLPVVHQDKIIGVVHYNHIMKGLVMRAKT
ncbi:MAG TPA: CBS domain-containing protein [Candidatus Acidoferrum sp.]|nr:CBS domain-containing protein [Candidatus Acidoferrum sp.]